MTTFRKPILGHATVSDATGDVFFEPYSIKATNDVWRHLVIVFNDTAARHGLYGLFEVPQNYVGSANTVVVWTAAAVAAAGDVVWDFDYRAVGGEDAESLDQAGTQESVTATDTAPSAIHERLEVTIALTDGNFAVGDTVEFSLWRDGSDGNDDMSAAALLFELFFEYDDA